MKRVFSQTFFLAVVGASLMVSCSKSEIANPDGEILPGDISTKVVKLGDVYTQDSFLVKFTSVPTEQMLLSIEAEEGVTLEKVFPSTPGKEALEAKWGLDRWYEVGLGEDADLDESLCRMASRGSVAVAQYQTIAQKASDCRVYSAGEPAPGTKANTPAFNDPYLSSQWHYTNYGSAAVSPSAASGADINVAPVWESLTCGDPDIIVAVVDEGVKYSHPDLAANMWKNTREVPGNGVDDDGNGYVDDIYGFNFATNGEISWDQSGDVGHGTHCAGTIAAVNNNGTGVAGVAGGSGKNDGCRIMSCQIFSGNSGGSTKVVSRAVKYAADMGASVISCSFGYSTAFNSDNAYKASQGTAEIDAIHYFEDCRNNPVLDGNIAIFAAGNEEQAFAHYPGAFVDIISVSAFGPDFLPAYYTNYGPGCNITAPGGEAYHKGGTWASMVLSTIPSEVSSYNMDGGSSTGNDYAYMQGTSMACPHVSGVVALALSYAKKIGKTFTRDEFKRMILASTDDIDQRIANTSEKTYAYYHKPLPMAPYYHQMGTGAIDTWRLAMHIEGTPSETATLGKSQWIDLTPIFGTSSVSLTYLDVKVPEATVSSLGLQQIQGASDKKYPAVPESGYALVQFGRLYIYPTKAGGGKITITAVGGGSAVGGNNNPPGGMELTREISIVAREVDGGNGTGGWL